MEGESFFVRHGEDFFEATQWTRGPWNPQHHLLYHTLVEKGFGLWKLRFGVDSDSAFGYLKLFTALTGLAFLLALRFLFKEFGVPPFRRICFLLLAGLSVSAWFHFTAFETYCLAMPALVLYFVALHRLIRRGSRRLPDRTTSVRVA